jgi:hypothetical protein
LLPDEISQLLILLPVMKNNLPATQSRFIISLFLITSYLPLSGQAPNLVTTVSNSFGGSLSEEFFGGSLCSDGGYLLTGLTNSIDGDINLLGVYDTSEIFVVKCNAQGIKQWAKTFGGSDYDKARYGIEDASGDYLIVGFTHSSDGDITFTHGNSELFVLKLNSTGDKIWMKQYGGTNFESGRYISQLSDGNYLVAGYSASSNNDLPQGNGGHDGWLMKIDTSGTIIWSKSYGGSSADRIRCFVPTIDGGFLFAGSSQSNNFDCTGNHGGTDVWIGKVDSIGDLQWSTLVGGSDEDYAYHVTSLMNGNFLVTGFTSSNDGDITGLHGNTDGLIIEVDNSGNIIQIKCFGGVYADRLYRCQQTATGEIVTAGYSKSHNGDLLGINGSSSKAFWVMSLDSNLQMNWGYCTGGSGADLGVELIYDNNDGSIVLIGDSDSNDGNVLGNHGGFDFWIVKLSLSTGLSNIEVPAEPAIWFNSENAQLMIQSESSFPGKISIWSESGKLLWKSASKLFQNGLNEIPLPLYLTQMNRVLLVELTAGSRTISRKMPVFGID